MWYWVTSITWLTNLDQLSNKTLWGTQTLMLGHGDNEGNWNGTPQHTSHVICSSKLPLHGRSISRRACAHMSPNWTRLWCIGAPALHLWAITEMHRQWWGKTPGGQTEQSERGGLWWPAFTLSCFCANCPTNRRAQTPPVAHHALQREGGIYRPLSNWSAWCLTTVH